MKLQTLIETVLESRVLTFPQEQQLNDLMWSQQTDPADLEALQQLVEALLSRKVQQLQPSFAGSSKFTAIASLS